MSDTSLMATGARTHSLRQASIWKRYAYLWVTLVLFLVSLVGHWWLGWSAYVSEQQLHGATPQVSDYLVEAGRDTLENWQSEFLQLIWQVAGLALLLHVGSPQSREEDDRLEEKLDAILRAVNAEDGERIIAELDERFDRGKPSA
jgi:hypothetical protein